LQLPVLIKKSGAVNSLGRWNLDFLKKQLSVGKSTVFLSETNT
jgi:hypothetical protein